MSEPGSFLRRRARGAVTRTTSLVEGQVASTARVIVDDLEPYLAEVTVPQLVDALVPHLIERVVPQVLDGVTEHVARVTVPQVLAEATPRLADEILPPLLEALRPYLESELIPAVVDAVTEHLAGVTVPDVLVTATPRLGDEILPPLLDRLRPYLDAVLVPAVVDAVTPHLIGVTAPRVVEGLMPKIRAEVVPQVLDDFVADPRVRELIRQQSLGLVVDGFESFRRALAAGDDRVERVVRRVRRARPVDDVSPADVPPGRTRSHAGVVTRGVAYGVDAGLVTFVASQGLSALLASLDAVFGSVPTAVAVVATAAAVAAGPVYFGLAWWLFGRTVGGAVTGFRVCRTAGGRVGPVRAAVRATAGVLLVAVWAVGMLHSTVDSARRGWLDLVTGTRAPYQASGWHPPPRRQPGGASP
jgi:uncharacterized RDD family membrane protein YckC